MLKLRKASMARFELDPEVPETGLQSGVRNIARTTARGGEAVAGAPADVVVGGANLLDMLIKKGPLFGETAGQPLFGAGRIGEYLPTSQNIKKHVTGRIAEHLPEGYLEPQSATEEFSDEVFGTIASLASPLLGGAKMGLKAATALGGGGSLAKFAAKEMGASPELQEGVKTGSMLLGSYLGSKALGTAKKDMYAASEAGIESLPPRTAVQSPKVFTAVRKIDDIIASGAIGKPEKKALNFIRDVQHQLNYSNKNIPLESLTRLKKQLNNMIYNSTDVAETKAATELLKPLKTAFLETLEDNRTKYPTVIDNLLMADEIHAATSRISGIKDFVKENIKEGFKSNFTTLLFGNLFGPLKNLSRAKAAINFGTGVYQAGKGGLQILSTLLQSPQIRKHYWETMNNALKMNATGFLRSARKLDEAILKEEQDIQQGSRYILD